MILNYRRCLPYLVLPTLFLLTNINAESTAMTTWRGSYIGAYIGGAFAYNTTTTNVGSISDTSYFSTQADTTLVTNLGTSANRPNNFIGGIQVGHDWEPSKIVYGVAMDYGSFYMNAANNQNHISFPDNTNQFNLDTSEATRWLLTLRGRLGYPVTWHCPILFYATGGMAITQFKINNTYADNTSSLGVGNIQSNLYELGWTAGAGIDFAVLKKLSIDTEYLYVGMPIITSNSTIENTVAGFGSPVGSQISPFDVADQFHANIIRFGMNYRFNE